MNASATEVEALLEALPPIAAGAVTSWQRDLARVLLAQARRPDWRPSPAQIERMRILAKEAGGA